MDVITLAFQKGVEEIERLKETIKGLDRATVEYTRIIAENGADIKRLKEACASYDDIFIEQSQNIGTLERTIKGLNERIATLTNVNESHVAMLNLKHNEVNELEERIASLLEADASRPTRDTNGTIEAQQSLIRKLKGDVLALQRKVQEQDETIATWKGIREQ